MGTEVEQPEANDNDLEWELLVKEDGIFIHWIADDTLVNLGPKNPVCEEMCRVMAAIDFQ